VPEEDWPVDEAQRGVILGDFAAGCGDRRQEIVFIGVNMDEVRGGWGGWGRKGVWAGCGWWNAFRAAAEGREELSCNWQVG
jgi:hypothetical protein